MDRIINKKYIFILIIAFIMSFSIGYFTTNNGLNEEANAAAQDPNYDKMMITYVNVKERKTGQEPFDSTTDDNGNDENDTNEYVRTFDSVYYSIEVGIERNPETTTATETIKGGKIKVKATIPQNYDIQYLSFIKDGWMQPYNVNSDHTELTATYTIPSDKTAIGGTQQLSFTVVASGNEKQLTAADMPIFEVWMEGNKPDNESSSVNSVITQDPKTPLKITGKINAYLELNSGKINVGSELNGVKGQYVNFFSKVYIPTRIGGENPVDILSSSFKIEYRFKKSTDSTWTNLDSVEGVTDPINGTILYSYGRPCEPTPGFWMNENMNTSSNAGYCASQDKSVSPGNNVYYKYQYDSGVMNASQTGNIVNFSNTNFYSENFYPDPSYKTIAAQGFELFIPFYEPEPGNYDYEIKVIDTSLTVKDHNNQEYTSSPNKSITFKFSNYLTGNFDFNLSSPAIFTDVAELSMGKKRYFDSYVRADDGPYEGGIVKLEVWNSKYVNFVPDATHPSIYYNNGGIFDTPSKERAVMQFGIYKNDRENGVTSDEQVNASKFDDFDWYDTYEEAMLHGKITAIRTDEPDWRGYSVRSYIYDVYLMPIENLNNVGKTGIIRFWAYVYEDEARTKVLKIGDSVDYIGAVINDDGTGLSSEATPARIGQTFVITGITLDVSTKTADLRTNYNVEEEIINMNISPSFSTGITDASGEADFVIEALLPKDLSFIEGSSNYVPASVTTDSTGKTTIVWNFNNWNLADPLPIITYQADISPYTRNNASMTVYAYISSPSVIGAKKNTRYDFTITNLAGSSLRKKLSNDKVERNETVDINDYIYNIAQSRLMDFKSYEILPKNGDNWGTHYSGSYTIKVIELADTQRIFYTTNPTNNIGLEPDSVGKMHIQNVDLPNDNRWIEVGVGDTIPSNATAIASYFPEVSAQSDIGYKLKFIPTGNTYLDEYYFQLIGSSANLDNAISSEVKVVSVVDRKVSGMVFLDNNRNGKYDNNTDTKLANKKVYLVDENDEVVREMTTDSNGYYEGEHFERGTYYIKYISEFGQEFVAKNVGSASVSSSVNSDGKTDLIQEFSQNPTNALMHAENKNIGLRYKEAQVVVHHYVKNTITKVHDDVYLNDKTYYYNDEYSTSDIPSSELYDDYKNVYQVVNDDTPKSGVVNADLVEVVYYYEPRPATITTHHYLVGTTQSVFDDVITEEYYGNTYSTSRINSAEYVDAGHAGDDPSAVVTRQSYEVIYYYAIRKATITAHHYITGTTTRVHDDDSFERDFNTSYSTDYYDTTALFSDYQNKYFYTNVHTGDNPSGTVNKDSYEITYFYNVKPAIIKVHHYIIGTTTKVYDDEQFNKNYGYSYQTHYKDTSELFVEYRNQYFYNSSTGDEITGVVNKDIYEITYYYGVQNATITVHHYLDGTTTKVHEDDIISKMFFEHYDTRAYNPGDLISPYTDKYFYNNNYSGDARSGNVGKSRYEIIYYYELRDAEIITNYYKLGTEDKVQDSKIMYKKITENYNTRPLETEELYNRYRNVYVYSNESSGDYTSGVVDKVRYVVNYFYVPKESTITVHHYEIDKNGVRTTNRVHDDDTITKSYLEEYVTNPYDSSRLSGNYQNNYYYNNVHTGTTEGVVGTDNIEITYYYEAKPSRVVVHHYVEGTDNKVHADDVLNKKYTDNYETRSFNTDELIGDYQNNYYYHNHHTGDNLTGIINKDNYEITYYYELRPSTIKVHHYLIGTTTKVHADDTFNDTYTDEYNIVPYEPSELDGNYKNNYYYHGEYSGDSLTGVINKDNYEITIYYEPRPSVITVHHYLVDTITKVHPDDVINKVYGETYATNSYQTGELDNPYKNVYSYNNTNSGDEKNGTVNKDNYEVIYYYDFRPSTVTVHHYIKGTTTKVHDDDILDKKFMDIYQTSPYDTSNLLGEYQNWYEYNNEKAGDQPNGTIIGEQYEITYYYDKRDAKVIVHHYIVDTETKLADDVVINLKLRDHYETSSKDSQELNLRNYTYASVVGDATGTIDEVEREITYYYKLKEAQLIVHYIAEDTNEKLCDDIIEDVTYQDAYTTDSCTTLRDINYAYKNVVTNDTNSEQRGMRTLGNILQDVVEVTYYYELKPGQIVVHFFEIGTRNRIADDIVVDGKASKEYVSEPKDIEGFTLVNSPENNVHIFSDNTQEVVYEYERITYNILVTVSGGVGSAAGSEEVLYENDSKEGYITIKPSEGYVIDKVLVDGEEIDITDNKGMILNNFKKVNKNHKIEVLFTEEEIPVPITGISKKIIVIALIILSIGIMYLAVNNGLKKQIN